LLTNNLGIAFTKPPARVLICETACVSIVLQPAVNEQEALILWEEDVFAGVSRGMKNKEIAGEKTVKRYMTRITRKLQV